MVDNIGLQSVLCYYATEFKRFDNRCLSPPHIASARHPPLFSRLQPRTAPPLNRPPCSPRRAPPSPFQQPPPAHSHPPACRHVRHRKATTEVSPPLPRLQPPSGPSRFFVCAQTARLTHAAPAAPPFSHSFGLHPPLHASHPFIARPPSPSPVRLPPSRAGSIACFTWKHPARAAQRLLCATRRQRLRSRRLQPVQPPHAPKYPRGRRPSPFSSNVCPPYAGRIFLPFVLYPLPRLCLFLHGLRRVHHCSVRSRRPCKPRISQPCAWGVPPWAFPWAARMSHW